MEITRRSLASFMAGSTATMVLAERKAHAVPELFNQAAPFEFEADKPVPTLDELLVAAPPARGNEPPYRDEVKLGRAIMSKAPSNTTPFNTAQYFYSLSTGLLDDEFGPSAFAYGSEWPVRANPVIVSFFDATTRIPNGDITPWCAAFVNYCISRARQGRTNGETLEETKSAAALSFREWGQSTENPKPGDIAVFQHKRKELNGHVGFFVAEVPKGIYLLGGNQMPLRAKLPDGTYEAKNTGEVNMKLMPRDGKDLKLIAFRTHPSLHD